MEAKLSLRCRISHTIETTVVQARMAAGNSAAISARCHSTAGSESPGPYSCPGSEVVNRSGLPSSMAAKRMGRRMIQVRTRFRLITAAARQVSPLSVPLRGVR
jgi:hypothetical protein